MKDRTLKRGIKRSIRRAIRKTVKCIRTFKNSSENNQFDPIALMLAGVFVGSCILGSLNGLSAQASLRDGLIETKAYALTDEEAAPQKKDLAVEVVPVTLANEIDKLGREIEEVAKVEIETTEVEAEAYLAQAEEKQMEVAVDTAESEETTSNKNDVDKAKSIGTDLGLPIDYDYARALEAMNYLINEQGFTEEGAAGIVGNLFSECRMDSSLINGSHKGICQWDSVDRWPKVQRWLEDNGYEITSYAGQLRAIFESDDAKSFPNTFESMRKAGNARDAARLWLYDYERAPGQAEQERQNIAELTYKLYIQL